MSNLTIPLPTVLTEKPDTAQTIANSFMNVASVDMGRGTFYNSADEVENARNAAHQELFDLDRGLYALFLLLPDLTDRTKQRGINQLLANGFLGGCLTGDQEQRVVGYLVRSLPIQRVYKGLLQLRRLKPSSARTGASARVRKLILRIVFRDPKLERHAVEYRVKLRKLLEYAWGRSAAGIVKSIAGKSPEFRTTMETKSLQQRIGRFLEGEADVESACTIAHFILGGEPQERLDKLPLIRAYFDARQDLALGARLPLETLDGIRRCYHKEATRAQVLELTQKNLTKGQRLNIQHQAKDAGVQIEVDFSKVDAVKLYLYAYEQGLTDEVADALQVQARKAASGFALAYKRATIIADLSQSAFGAKAQPLRPAATTLALKDALVAAIPEAQVRYVHAPEVVDNAMQLVEPNGDTSLAEALAFSLCEDEPDAIFVITDGYENAPAGRFAEVVKIARDQLGVTLPIYQITPVIAAESRGIRQLSAEIPALAVSCPKNLATALLKLSLQSDLGMAVQMLARNNAALLQGA